MGETQTRFRNDYDKDVFCAPKVGVSDEACVDSSDMRHLRPVQATRLLETSINPHIMYARRVQGNKTSVAQSSLTRTTF